jgi:hypothetical protein
MLVQVQSGAHPVTFQPKVHSAVIAKTSYLERASYPISNSNLNVLVEEAGHPHAPADVLLGYFEVAIGEVNDGFACDFAPYLCGKESFQVGVIDIETWPVSLGERAAETLMEIGLVITVPLGLGSLVQIAQASDLLGLQA